MKKHILLVAIATTLSISSCKDDKKEDPIKPPAIEVKQQQNAIFFDITATWCPPCGTYGMPAFMAAINTHPEKTVAINTHVPTSDLGTAMGQEIASYYDAKSIPTLVVGNQSTNAFTDIDYTKNMLLGYAQMIWTKTALANTKLTATKEGESVKLTTHTKFFANGETKGKYRLSVWMLEDGVMNKQEHSTGGSKIVEHNHVLRASLTPTFGNTLSSEAIVKDKIFTQAFTTSVAGKTSAKISFVAVVWYETTENGKPVYTFVNADKVRLQ